MKKHLYFEMKRMLCAAAAGLLLSSPAAAKLPFADLAEEAARLVRAPLAVPAHVAIETGFSPQAGALDLVLKVIDTAHHRIELMGYSFTSKPVTQALIRAKKRGVEVFVVVDNEQNVLGRGAGRNSAVIALNALSHAGVVVRTLNISGSAHDKVIISDKRHVQTGSFNFSEAAHRVNSENVLVVWNHPELAQVYRQHWQRNWSQADAYAPAY